MKEKLEKMFFQGLGLTMGVKEKLESAVRVLMAETKMKEPEARAFVVNLANAAEEKKGALEKIIKAEINRVAKKVEKATRTKSAKQK